MNKATMTAVAKATGFDIKLLRAVARQSGGWADFLERAPDIAKHGIDGGFHGWIYYSDTVPFCKRNRELILAMAEQQAAGFGMSVVDMIAGFNCLRRDNGPELHSEIGRTLYGGRARDGDYLVANALAWYAAEEAARAVADYLESRR